MDNIRKKYSHLNKTIKKEIERKNIDISKVIEKYSEGISEENIMILFKLTKDELSYIVSKHVTAEIILKRNKSIQLVKGFKYNCMGMSKQHSKDDEEVLSIKEALALFEER